MHIIVQTRSPQHLHTKVSHVEYQCESINPLSLLKKQKKLNYILEQSLVFTCVGVYLCTKWSSCTI